MYCMRCGVQLADTENVCPLCGLPVFHPELVREEASPLYPAQREPNYQVSPTGGRIIVTTAFLLAALVTMVCDLQINRAIHWSGFVVGALMLCYVIAVLPCWFRRPNPVVLVPCDFAALGLYLLYIDLTTAGGWFLSFAFPVVAGAGLIVTAVVTLLRYLRRGMLYVFGGATIALGAFMPLMEFLLCLTFEKVHFVGWSWYPLTALVLLGGMLIFLAICRPAREEMEQKFFL